MGQTIWKFPFEVTDFIGLSMPQGAKILSVGVQGATPCVWAFIPDANAPREQRHFRVYGTGHSVDEVGEFVGTFQLMGGNFIGHLFEIG